MAETFSNWNHSAESHPQVAEHPSTPGELAMIVKDVNGHPSPVRPAGEFHSVNPCFAADNGTQVCMDRFTKCVVDEATGLITVGAGKTLVNIRDALRPFKLELPVSPEIGNATAGSVACAGTKDSSLFEAPPTTGNEKTIPPGFGQVGSAVTSVRMIDASGTDVLVTDPAQLRDIRSSYGLLGILYEVTFQAQPLVPLRYSHEFIKFDPAKPPTIDRLFGPHTHAVLGFLEPYRTGILVERRRRDPNATIGEPDELKRHTRDWLWEWGASEATTLLITLGKIFGGASGLTQFSSHPFARFLGPLASRIVPLLSTLEHADQRNPTDALLDLFDLVTPEVLIALGGFAAYRSDSNIHFTRDRSTFFDFAFWAYPVKSWSTVVPKFITFCKNYHATNGFRPALFTEVYFIAADDRSLLSFAPQEHVFTLDMVHSEPNNPLWKDMNAKYNQLAASWGGRPVLNQTKELDATPQVVAQALPNWPAFKASLKQTPAYNRFCANTFFDKF